MTQISELLFRWDQLLLLIIAAFIFLYYRATKRFDYWSSKGIPYKKPVPFFGNSLKPLLSLTTQHQSQQEVYNLIKDTPYIGVYNFSTPKLQLRDPELIEQVLITDFAYAGEREAPPDADKGPGLSAHLLNMAGPRWKSLRTKLSPVFTSGKLKMMKDQFEICSDRLAEYLREEVKTGEPVEAKYVMSGFTMDVIGSCAFGLDFNAISDPNCTFRTIAKMIFGPSNFGLLYIVLITRFPKIRKIINLFRPSPPINSEKYVTGLVNDTIKYREDNNIKRNDFVQLLMEIRDQDKEKTPNENEVIMDERVMASNSFIFLIAGYETTASTLTFLLYELAVNQDIQQKLYEDIVQILNKHNGDLNWECLKDMKYLQQVISETLRMHPPIHEITRRIAKPLKFKNTDFVAPAGLQVQIPIYSLHYDPKYFPDPEKFDPDRFSEENKHKIVKGSYLPFADGPRICIGMRFALMEIKMAISKLLLEFIVTLDPKTISPLQYTPGSFLPTPRGGIWLNFSDRKNNSKVA